MPSYFGIQTKNSEHVSQRYLHINNCGFHEDLPRMNVCRADGRTDYQLIYIKSGQILFDLPDEQLYLGGGSLFLYRPGEPQRYRICGTPTTFFWIHFTGTAVQEMLSFFRHAVLETGAFPEFERYCRSFYMDRRLKDRYNSLLYEGELIRLIALASDRSGVHAAQHKEYGKIRKALLAMNRSLSPRLSNEELSALCGLNKFYFIKVFKIATGLTPQQYYASLVIDQSRELLDNTDYSIEEISSLCGIEDCFYFSRLFKKHTGLSPANYRKLQR